MAKTNQLMNVKIVEGLTIKVHNKSLMGRVSDIIIFGNQLRVDRGLSKITLKEILRKQDFWEFIIARNTHWHLGIIFTNPPVKIIFKPVQIV